MTRKLVKVFCIMAALSFVTMGACWAQGLKVGYLDMQKLGAISKKAQDIQKKLQEKAIAKKTELENKRKEMEDLKSKLDHQGPMLTDQTRDDMLEKLGIAEIKYKRAESEAQRWIQNEQRDLMETLQRDVENIVEKVRAQKDLTFVLNKQVLVAVNGDPTLDITDEVARMYDSGIVAEPKPKAAAPAAGPAKPAAPKGIPR